MSHHHRKYGPINKWAQAQVQEAYGPKSKPNLQMGSSPNPTNKWAEVQAHQANELRST